MPRKKKNKVYRVWEIHTNKVRVMNKVKTKVENGRIIWGDEPAFLDFPWDRVVKIQVTIKEEVSNEEMAAKDN